MFLETYKFPSVPSRQSIFDTHQQIIDKFYDEFFGNRKFFNVNQSSYPKMDITEDADYLYIKCAVPGILDEDIDVETNKEEKILTIKGQTSSSHVISNGLLTHMRELKNSSFSRSIRLPDYVDIDKCSADLKDGMLSLTFDLHKPEKQIEESKVKKISLNKK